MTSQMSENMLKFVKIDQQNPTKRDIGRRKDDFKEHDPFIQT